MLSTETATALKVGALTGAGTVAIEASGGQLGVVWPIVSGLVGAGVAYGILRGAVDMLRQQVGQINHELAAIRESTHTTAERVARIEGTMERRSRPRE
jgi:hypothetical protein